MRVTRNLRTDGSRKLRSASVRSLIANDTFRYLGTNGGLTELFKWRSFPSAENCSEPHHSVSAEPGTTGTRVPSRVCVLQRTRCHRRLLGALSRKGAALECIRVTRSGGIHVHPADRILDRILGAGGKLSGRRVHPVLSVSITRS